MAMEHTQLLLVNRSADEVWEWMKDARNVIGMNIFHERVEWDEPITRAGVRVPVPHNFFGLHRERRGVTVRAYRRYHVGFGEYKLKEEKGIDVFPHSQELTVVPVDDKRSILVNHIRGVYVFPVPKFFREYLFRKYIPKILHDDNCVCAVGVGAMSPDEIRKPFGLILWPAMVFFGGKFIKQSTRTRIIEQAKSYKPTSKVEAGAGAGPGA